MLSSSPSSPPPPAVIFDCDGTLADSMGVWRVVESDLAHRAGRELTRADVEELTTMSIPECGAFFHDRLGLGRDGQDVVDMINETMLDFYSRRVEPRPGALEFVQELAAYGVPMAIASSTPQKLLEAAVHHMGFDDYVCAVVSVDLVGASKRDPAVYDRARATLGPERAQTWGFEDSIYAIRTLNNAGFHTCGVYDCDKSGTYDMLVHLADMAIRSFADIDAESFLAIARNRRSFS